MDDRARTDEGRVLRVELDVSLERQPIRGRLRAEGGVEELFVGWLGFVDALRRVEERERGKHELPGGGEGVG